ncbi:MAG: histidine kinase N-terminal 7TM domain-containing protein [Anaerolineales bacterium]
MAFQNNPYAYAVIIAGIVSILGALAAYQRRTVAGAYNLVMLLSALAVWMVAYALELASAQLATQLLFVKIKYLGIVSAPLLFLIFAVRFAMPGRSVRWLAVLLSIVPVITLGLVWTNDLHGLIWYDAAPAFNGTFFSFSYKSGFAFWAWAVYAYVLMISGSVILVGHAYRTYAEHRAQAWLLIAATLATWLGNIVYVTGNSPVPYLDITPFTLTLAALLLTWGIYRAGLFERIPIAGEDILASLNDAVIVIDLQKRIVMANPTFEYYTKLHPPNLIGEPTQEALKTWPELADLTLNDAIRRREIELRLESNYSLFFDVRVSPIRNQEGEVIGRAYILNDITERKQSERRLRSEDESADTSSTEIIPVVFVYRQGDGKIVEANRTFIIKTGYNRGELMGQSLLQLSLWTAEERAAFIRALRDNNGKIDGYTLTLIARSGEAVPLIASAQTAEVKGEKYVMVIGQSV